LIDRFIQQAKKRRTVFEPAAAADARTFFWLGGNDNICKRWWEILVEYNSCWYY